MKNTHATKKQKKQKADPRGSKRATFNLQPSTAPAEPATFNLQPATESQPATDPPPPPETDEPPKGPQRRRRGNVARLPKIVRDQINQMILDGVPYSQIIIDL